MRRPLAEDGSFFLNSASMLYLLISIQFNAFPMTKLICSQLLFIYYWSRPHYGREQHHDRLPFCEPIKIHFKVAKELNTFNKHRFSYRNETKPWNKTTRFCETIFLRIMYVCSEIIHYNLACERVWKLLHMHLLLLFQLYKFQNKS